MLNNNITEKELVNNLNEFRDVLLNYDYSEVDNVIFLNIESLNYYIKTHKNNPFERQYQDLERLFNKIMPYIPSNIPNEAIEVITKLLKSRYNDDKIIKKNIDFNIRMDFIQTIKCIRTEEQWNKLVEECKSIFNSKVTALTH